MVNFPASLDSLANPTATTNRDDVGFPHHQQHSDANDILEFLESKLGITDSPASNSPLANTVLTSLANGKSGWATIVTAMLAANAVTQVGTAAGSTSGPTTTSTSRIDMTEMAVTLTTVGGGLLALMSVTHENNTAGQFNEIGFNIDAGSDSVEATVKFTAANDRESTFVWRYFTGVSAASHTVKGRWDVTGGTGTLITTQRKLLVLELKR